MDASSPSPSQTRLPEGYRAAVIGASGAIGGAVAEVLCADPRAGEVIRLSRRGPHPIDLADEASIAAAADRAGRVDLVFVASGALHVELDGARRPPEKALSQLEATALSAAFAVNAIGPALVAKHFSAALPRAGRGVIVALSARVGSIGDNRLGGWYGYRASKAALNQLIRTAAVEIARKRPEAVIAALHPGTVESALSRPYRPAGAGVEGVFTPIEAAAQLLGVVDRLTPASSGGFFDYAGREIPW